MQSVLLESRYRPQQKRNNPFDPSQNDKNVDIFFSFDQDMFHYILAAIVIGFYFGDFWKVVVGSALKIIPQKET